jgi:acyl carrier protein
MDDLEERMKHIFAHQLGVAETQITNKTSFINDLGADSLDTIELVLAIEEEFDLKISDRQAEMILTVEGAIDFARTYGKRIWCKSSGESVRVVGANELMADDEQAEECGRVVRRTAF